MKLATEASVKAALVIGDGLDIIDASIVSALHTATQDLAGALLHDFDAGSFVDIFHIYSTFRAGACYRATLALRQGFVTSTPVVLWADSYAGLADGEVVETTEYRVDTERGAIIIDSETNYVDRYLKVTYAAGFAANDTDIELYEPDVVPDWLERAATLHAAGTVVLLNPDLAGGGNGGEKRDAKELKATGLRIAERHIRYFPSAIRPI